MGCQCACLQDEATRAQVELHDVNKFGIKKDVATMGMSRSENRKERYALNKPIKLAYWKIRGLG